MATITEDYVNFETAKLLKEKGFNEETAHVYSNNGELLRLSHLGIKDLTNANCNDYHTWQFPIENVASIISAPTLQMAMKWLREVHNIIIEPESVWNGKKWEYLLFVVTPQNADSPYYEHNPYKSYEECVESAIKYYLEHFI